MPLDRDYLERRFRQSVDAAERAHYSNVASIHREMAASYAKALTQLEREQQGSEETGTSARDA